MKLLDLNSKKNRLLLAAFCTYVFGIIANAFCYFNMNYSNDSLLVYQDDSVWQISIGRYLHPVYFWIRGNLYTPFWVGLIALFFLSMSNWMLIELFEFKKIYLVLFTCGIMTVNASETLLHATYLHDLDIYAVSLALSVGAVYAFFRWRKFKWISFIFVALSLGLYQSYIQVTIFLFMIMFVKQLLEDRTVKNVIFDGLKAICSIIAGGITFYVIWKVVQWGTNIELGQGYHGPLFASLGKYTLDSLIYSIVNTIYREKVWLCSPLTYHSSLMGILNICILLIMAVSGLFLLIKKKLSILTNIVIFILIAFMPYGMNIVCFLTQGMEHELMMYSFYLIYPFALLLIEKCCEYLGDLNIKKWYRKVIPVILGIFLFNNIIFANEAYMLKEVEYDATLSTMTRVLDRIEQVDGYQVGETPTAIVGSLENSTLGIERNGFDYSGVGMNQIFSATNNRTYELYLHRVLAYPVNLIEEENVFELYENSEYIQDMPCFPEKNSCQIVDGVLVVKFSDIEDIE